jgi:hypothetical protein
MSGLARVMQHNIASAFFRVVTTGQVATSLSNRAGGP